MYSLIDKLWSLKVVSNDHFEIIYVYAVKQHHPYSLPVLQPPYLYSMHNSPVKAIQVYSDVSKELVQTISQVGRVQLETIYSAQCKMWPIDGGVVDPPKHDNRELLISGYVRVIMIEGNAFVSVETVIK